MYVYLIIFICFLGEQKIKEKYVREFECTGERWNARRFSSLFSLDKCKESSQNVYSSTI